MDKDKIIEAAKPSVIVLVAFALVKFYFINFMKGSIFYDIAGVPFDLIFLLFVLYAGYRATRTMGLDIPSAAAAGALAALAETAVWFVLMFVGVAVVYKTGEVPIPKELTDTLGAGGTFAALMMVMLVFSLIIAVVSLVINAVIGAVGGFIGQRLK